MVTDAPGWRDRVVDRSIARSTEYLKARGLGPATRILEAAIALSTESSGASFSIQQVVEKADVALKTFYRHFGSKDALLLAMLEESIADSVGVIGESALQHADPVEQLRVIIVEPVMRAEVGKAGYELSVAREHFRLLELFPDEIERAVAPYVDLVESAIIRCVDAGRLRSVDPHQDADLINNLVLSTFHRLCLRALKEPPEVAAAQCWDFCFRALRPSAVAVPSPAPTRRGTANPSAAGGAAKKAASNAKAADSRSTKAKAKAAPKGTGRKA
jgi:AcrR family transcriptional regulator